MSRRDKKIYPLIVLLCCLLVPSILNAGDYDGEWLATVTKASSTCKSIGRAIESDYEAVIQQKQGETLTLTVKKTGTVFHGIKLKTDREDDPRLIRLVASYLEEAGIISQKMNIEMSNTNSGTGSTSWSWSDGLMICGGHYIFTLKRKE